MGQLRVVGHAISTSVLVGVVAKLVKFLEHGDG